MEKKNDIFDWEGVTKFIKTENSNSVKNEDVKLKSILNEYNSPMLP